jgi:O-antigen/teichoic acid export membrane protein
MMKNNGVIAAAQILWQSLALFVVYRIGAQAAGLGVLGAWSTAVAVAGLITLADVGLTDVLVREVARANGRADWGRAKGLCRAVLKLVPLTVGLLGVVATPAIAYLLEELTPALPSTATLGLAAGAVAFVWLTVLGTGAAGVLEAFGRYDLKALAAFVSSTASIPVAYIVAGRAPELALVAAMLTAGSLNLLSLLLAGYAVVGRLPGEAQAPTRAERNEMLRLGFNARVGALANYGFDPVVRFLLLRFGGPEPAGLYEIAYRLVIQLRAVWVASTQVIVPRLTTENARGGGNASAAIAALTASSVRLAGPMLWGVLMILPLLSVALLQAVEPELLWYGLALTLGWLVNAIAVPAYFGNFVEGALGTNRTSHLAMLVAVVVLGVPGGMLFGGPGVVVATAAAVGLGSAFILASRRRDLAAMAIGATRADLVVNLVGLACVTGAYALVLASVPAAQQLYGFLALAAVHFAASTPFILRRVREHLRRVAG